MPSFDHTTYYSTCFAELVQYFSSDQKLTTAKFVKVHVDSYWAIGGGLNEIQVY